MCCISGKHYFCAQMNVRLLNLWMLCACTALLVSCAQVMAPTGGPKDLVPPKLLAVMPADSQLNVNTTRIDLRFDEYVALNNAASEVTIAPILPFPLDITASKRSVTVKIPDSLLQPHTTYRIAFGNAIQDIHENNPFKGYTYTFSTGAFFDSLTLTGFIVDAATGLRDSGALVVLYDATKPHNAVVSEKPLYAVRADNGGNFRIDGLPERSFRIYAIRDANKNMTYDGVGEMVAFLDSTLTPAVNPFPVQLNIFAATDTTVGGDQAGEPATADKFNRAATKIPTPTESFTYTVAIDTSDLRKRTVDITKPIQINFTKPIQTFNPNRTTLTYDSLGVAVEVLLRGTIDTTRKNRLLLDAAWTPNTVYTLRLLRGFAQDSAGTDVMPSRYTFRTKQDEDYAKLHIHLPSKYYGSAFVFVLLNGKDTIYQQPVADTNIHFTRLSPGNYTMRVIIDRNQNGQWDSGDLLNKIQPEAVVPYPNPISLKPGWENMIDFEESRKPRFEGGKDKPGQLRR